MGSIAERAHEVFEGPIASLFECARDSKVAWFRTRSHLHRERPDEPSIPLSSLEALKYYSFYICERVVREGPVQVVQVRAVANVIKRRRSMCGISRNEFLHDVGIDPKDWNMLRDREKWGRIDAHSLSSACLLLGLDIHKVGVFTG